MVDATLKYNILCTGAITSTSSRQWVFAPMPNDPMAENSPENMTERAIPNASVEMSTRLNREFPVDFWNFTPFRMPSVLRFHTNM